MLERCSGLVFGFLFREGRRTVRVHDETLAQGLADGHDWAWLRLSLAAHRARRFQDSFDALPPDARALLLGTEDRIQLHLPPDGAWGILPDIERDFADQSLGSGRFGFWMDGGLLITARRHPLRAVEHLRHRIEEGAVPATPSQAIAQLQ